MKPKIIDETLQIEELKTLLKGGTIDFLDLEEQNTKIRINGKDFDSDLIKFISQVLDMGEVEFYLMEDILERYNNGDYWDWDLEETIRKDMESD